MYNQWRKLLKHENIYIFSDVDAKDVMSSFCIAESHVWNDEQCCIALEELQKEGVKLFDFGLKREIKSILGESAKYPFFIRCLFIPINKPPYVERFILVMPECFSEDKCLAVQTMRDEMCRKLGIADILEVSTKSDTEIGKELSAFNLKKFVDEENEWFSVENIYQSSKVFEDGGPYKELLYKTAKEAKKDERIKEKKVVSYDYNGRLFSSEPSSLFFNYIYMNALAENRKLCDEFMNYNAFTDVEFDPVSGTNCQARALAQYKGMQKNGIISNRGVSVQVLRKIEHC